MLAFAAPGALIGLAALAVPIALHLWSRRTGRPLRVGSVAFFAAAPPPATRRPRLEDVWLLLLRCGVLAALALALAGPSWRSDVATGSATWALVDSAVASDPRAQPLLDSLRSAGAELRAFGGGPIWSLLREADFEAPPGTRLVVVAPNRGAVGERPTLRNEVQWLVREATDVEEGRRSGGVEERRENVRTVLVLSDQGRREDARYVTAALRAAAEATQRSAVITQRDAGGATSPDADWIVWLAARAVPNAVLERVRRGAVLLSDALNDAPQAVSGRLRLAAATGLGSAPALRRRTQVDPGGAPLWTDESGRPVLTARREGAGLWLKFHARFHPTWGDLVLHPAFPDAVAALWAGNHARAPAAEDQAVTVSQLLPQRAQAPRRPAGSARDLYHVFWLAGLLCFLGERWLARRARAVAA